jgi:amino-acid N-acetyltransferase
MDRRGCCAQLRSWPIDEGPVWDSGLRAPLELARERGVRNVYLLTTTASQFFPRFGFAAIPRTELDPALAQSEELRGACPASALVMRAAL